MTETKHYDSFPVWMPILSAIVALSVYIIGAYVLFRLSIFAAIIYLLYCIWVEARVLSKSCVNCFYYGKLCGLGRSVLCSLLFRKGDPRKFVEREVSWTQMLPDFLVFIFPLLAGIVLLIMQFSWLVLLLLIILFILSFPGSAFIRGSFACKCCKQREIGCPAEKLFGKQKTRNAQNDP